MLLALTGLVETGRHTVKKGETLADIARAHHTTVDALVAANGLADPNHVVAGSTLVIPDGAGTTGGGDGRYVVRPGDTLAEIAQAHGTTVAALVEANGITRRNLIVIGSTLQIPGAGGGATAATGGGSAGGSYVVKSGDTLGKIAQAHGTTIAALVEANGITRRNLIVIGSTLQIPGAGGGAAAATGGGSAGGSYVVKSGDTLAEIAQAHGTTVTALVEANGITRRNLIVIGTTLLIPGVAAAPAAANWPGGTHMVQAGETMASIARKYGVSTEALAQVNGFVSPYRIYTGTRLGLAATPALPASIACPVPGGSFFNDWGFPRSGGRFHEGNDLFAPIGTPIYAPASGTVRQLTGVVGGLQFRLTAPDGTLYLGSHMSQFGAAGWVEAGTVVGYVGDSGNALGARPHLHFEIHPGGGGAVNPYPALAQAC